MSASEMVKVGVMGAGSIGCFVGGLLADEGLDVVLVGRRGLRNAIEEDGLEVEDLGGKRRTLGLDRIRFSLEPADLASCDVVLCCVKSGQTEQTAAQMSGVLRPDAVVVSLQNGVQNPRVLRAHLSQPVLAAIVEFNAIWRGPASFRRTTNGPLVVEKSADEGWAAVAAALRRAGLPVQEVADIQAMQWTKLLVNLNNAISALSGYPTAEMVVSEHRFLIAAVVEEGVRVLRAAGVGLRSFRGVPVGLMPTVMRLPRPLLKLLMRAQLQADPEARSSMWEDLTRGRKTEVAYLNGEIVSLAEQAGVDAPLNARIVQLIHEAEEAEQGPPDLSPAELRARLGL